MIPLVLVSYLLIAGIRIVKCYQCSNADPYPYYGCPLCINGVCHSKPLAGQSNAITFDEFNGPTLESFDDQVNPNMMESLVLSALISAVTTLFVIGVCLGCYYFATNSIYLRMLDE
eukprot:192059_1